MNNPMFSEDEPTYQHRVLVVWKVNGEWYEEETDMELHHDMDDSPCDCNDIAFFLSLKGLKPLELVYGYEILQ